MLRNQKTMMMAEVDGSRAKLSVVMRSLGGIQTSCTAGFDVDVSRNFYGLYVLFAKLRVS